MAKDVRLYLRRRRGPGRAGGDRGGHGLGLGALRGRAEPGADFTRIFPFVEGS